MTILAVIPFQVSAQEFTKTNKAVQLNLLSVDKLVGNYNNEIKIIFSDIDGTIVKMTEAGAKPVVPQSAKNAMKKLKKNKLRLVLITGRSYTEAKDVAKQLGNTNAYIISQQGAEIADYNGEVISQYSINHSESIKVLDFIAKLKNDKKLTFNEMVFVNGKPYSTQNFKCPNKWETIELVKSYSNLGENYQASKILIYESNPKDIEFVQAELKKHFPELQIDLGTKYFCEINSPNATKGAAIKKLAEILKVDLKNAATIGDAENDISMFQQVKPVGGVAIVVQNGMPKLKQNANYETSSVTEDGFSNAVDKILKNNSVLKKHIHQQ